MSSPETASNGSEHVESSSSIRSDILWLEGNVWESFYKKTLKWLEENLWIDLSKLGSTFSESTNWENNSSDIIWVATRPFGSSEIKIGLETPRIDYNWFTPWEYPFAHITTPYKWISSYRVDNIKLHPLLGFSQLSLKGTEGNLTTLQVKDQALKYTNKKAVWVKKNNPCNVSPFKGDVWRSWSSRVADGQNHGKYNSMEDWLASFMRLMRQDRYRNKSIQGINCSWMQGIYQPNEPDSLKALRITWITHACESLHVSPFDRLNTDDKETMMAFAQQTAINETGSYFDRATLERAYDKAFG